MMELLLSVLLPPDPDPLDLQTFPHPATCCEQTAACREHLRRLAAYRHLRGWGGGRWDAALEETGTRLAYWRQLEAAHACESDRDTSRCLARLRGMIGPGRYRRRWHPPQLPSDLPPVPGEAPRVPSAGGVNGQGVSP